MYPATNSASASGKSKGVLFVSAKSIIKKYKAKGKKTKQFQKFNWYFTTSIKLKVLFNKKIGNNRVIKHISKENVWAAALKEPKIVYLELLLQPAKIIPKTLKEEILKKKKKI